MSEKRGKKISLSEKLSHLIQTKPTTIESEDEDLMTVDKIASNENDSDYSADELDISKFRRINNGLLEEDDKKYLGTGISRRDLVSSSDGNAQSEEDNEVAQDSSVEDNNTEAENDDPEDYNDDDSGDEKDEEKTDKTRADEEVQSSDNDAGNKIKSPNSKQNENFNKKIFLKAASDIEKGKAIRNQLKICDFLLECRMKFQKCLLASNEFPNHKNFLKFKIKGDPLFQESVIECKKSLKHLLNSLLSFQNALLKSNNEFLTLRKSENKEVSNLDQAVSSDSEKDYKNNVVLQSKKFKTLNEFSTEISRRHADFQAYKNNTIQKWNDKTRIRYISNKNFSAFEQSTLKQIELVLLDKQRLIKRTQTKRSDYHVLGEDDKEPPNKKLATESEVMFNKSLNNKSRGLHKEIFDDDDFYHQLLGEMVKRKANDVTDPVQLGRQWMQLQKIRCKMKKTVDTRASKGRKVRFVVHPKLVNFMMPINNFNFYEESKTEFFNSLFGNTKK